MSLKNAMYLLVQKKKELLYCTQKYTWIKLFLILFNDQITQNFATQVYFPG